MAVDTASSPVAIASGREIFVSFKQAGRVTCPGDPGNPAGLAVDLFATKTFGADTEEAYHRLLTMTPTLGGGELDAALRSFSPQAPIHCVSRAG